MSRGDGYNDLSFDIRKNVIARLAEELKSKGNKNNEPGCLNVGQFFEEYINTSKNWAMFNDELLTIAKKALKQAESLLAKGHRYFLEGHAASRQFGAREAAEALRRFIFDCEQNCNWLAEGVGLFSGVQASKAGLL